ncbi:MAG: DNA-protecting protein DprA [Hyphomicrobium zavarzinii]|uniref:DNA-processing protein DprA n=1 Tax=Hyphomicrobium zavarzinii TaxID=48292 RepID=UPI001A42C700|nr:DNA-processing protein DprA [Hyphomicrobium zavarzinii]MBL8847338.1 DNA-protecting protein DprA [Hyphomicrobium zavarzinii]
MPKRDTPTLFTPAPLPVSLLDDAERLACLRLIRSSQVGPVTFRELINHFGGAANALKALPSFARRAGRAVDICPEEDAVAELRAARKVGARPVFTIEPGYPPALAAVDAPPPLLYVKGRPELLAAPCVAIVGSRQASAAGTKLSRLFARELAESGLVIVSGLARGIDAAAHEASLAYGTVAVLAGGVDIIYPPEHETLQARIGEEGCLLTEQPPGFVPRAKDFPRRNRLISGISLGVIVIEAARRSGTLVTARFAGEQGREVFAVPGHPLDPRAEGTNQLLKSGATLVTEARDVLDVLAPQLARQHKGLTEDRLASFTPEPAPEPQTTRASEPGDRERERVLAALGPNPIDIDEVVRATALDAREVRIVLMELDLAGEIARHGSQMVSRAVR